ncbi:MAG: Hint domain-containing protein [Xanthobacteraceae bacterium]
MGTPYSGPFPGTIAAGSTYSTVKIDSTSFSGNLSNAGTISGAATGISLQTGTITGAIIDSGLIVGTAVGISIDNLSEITGAQSAIKITGPTFTGGINNAGTLSGTSNGIFVGGTNGGNADVSTFSGGITNSGTITGGQGAGIGLYKDVDVAGGITNSGGITGTFGIIVDGVQTFANNIVNSTNDTITANVAGIVVSNVGQFGTNSPGGGIVNAGTITVTTGFSADGIFVGGHGSFGGFSGVSAFAGGITNTGTISAIAGRADGIVVGGLAASGGSVTVSTFSGGITNAGTISAGGEGILVGGTAYSFGIVTVATFSGDIVNSGAISVGGDGILIGGKVLFGFPSSAALATGVGIATFDGGITNSGVISAGDDGIVIGAGVSSEDGVSEALPFANVAQFTGNIVNSASVSGTSPGGTITGNIGIFVNDVATFTGNIVNATGASIVAETGSAIEIGARGGNLVYYTSFFGLSDVATTLPVESFIGGIINSGTISFSEGPGAFLRAGIQIGTTDGFAVEMQTFSGGITNTGTISVSTTATTGVIADIFVSGVSHFAGGITNSGTLSAHSDRVGTSGSGIVLYYDQTVAGGITNSGDISANFGIGVVNVATFKGDIVNTTSGTIHAGVDGIDVVGPGFTNDSTFLGSIVNQGSITATGVGIEVNGVAQFGSKTAAGNISNTGTITAATGIYVRAAITSDHAVVRTTIYGSIVDSGDILASKHGIWINAGSTISSAATAVSVSAPTFTGGITNAGAITAVKDGIRAEAAQTTSPFLGHGANPNSVAGSIVNTSNGTITAGGIGIDVSEVLTFAGGITNAGQIHATGSGIAVTSSAIFGSAGGGGITNTGHITSLEGHGINVYQDATFYGDIVNAASGTIFSGGVADGIQLFSDTLFSGGITNLGSITATQHSGIAVSFVSTFTGAISNSGTITANIADIVVRNVETFSGGISNSGALLNTGFTSSIGLDVSNVTSFSGGISNSGTIAGRLIGIDIDNVPTFSNGITNSGTVSAVTGIELTATPDVSVFDSGVIIGTGGTAIKFDGPSDNTLTLAAGYTITGDVVGGGTDTLQLGGTGSGSFDLSDVGVGEQYSGFTTFDVIGGTWTVTGAGSDWNVEGGTFEVSGSVTDTTVSTGGTLVILPGGSADPTTVDAGGSETIDSSASDSGALVYGTQYVDGAADGTTVYAGGRQVVQNGGTASNTVISGGTMEIVSGGSATGSVDFEGGGTLQIDGSQAPGLLLGGTALYNFKPGDMIDLTGVDYSTPNTAFVNESDQLQITEGGNTYEIQLTGDFTGDTFHLAADNGGSGPGTEITETPCYCPGTLIATPRGEQRVEELKIGDEVMTASGAARPIKWIGKRSYRGRFVMGRKDILPVCIKAGALEDNVPKRDLWISPNHAMYLDGVLIEAKDLVNGVSVVQAQSVESIEYFHVELETHDVIIAEGALAESFIDDDSRFLFHNAREYRALYPAAVTTIAQYCARRLQEGYEVEAVRRHIASRAGLSATKETARAGNLRGYVDRITGECVAGWAQNVDHPEAPVCLDILVGGVSVGEVLANRYREDLKQAGMGSGCHSFAFTVPPELVFAPEEIEVRRSLDGVALELTIDAWRMLRQSGGRRRAA